LINNIPDSFLYDDSAGSGITVYVADTGSNPDHDEYKNMPGSKRWIVPGYDPHAHGHNDPYGHGSCVLSMVSAPKYGTAKRADIVRVKMPWDDSVNSKGETEYHLPKSGFFHTLVAIKNDFDDGSKNPSKVGKAVVNFSFFAE
jgi:hypothetical protein